jgi:hypothetical protein
VNLEITAFILNAINAPRIPRTGKTLSPEMAMAVVGGINELVLQAIEEGHVERLQELVAPSVALLTAVA